MPQDIAAASIMLSECVGRAMECSRIMSRERLRTLAAFVSGLGALVAGMGVLGGGPRALVSGLGIFVGDLGALVGDWSQ